MKIKSLTVVNEFNSGKSKIFRKVKNISFKTNVFVLSEAQNGGKIGIFVILEAAVKALFANWTLSFFQCREYCSKANHSFGQLRSSTTVYTIPQ